VLVCIFMACGCARAPLRVKPVASITACALASIVRLLPAGAFPSANGRDCGLLVCQRLDASCPNVRQRHLHFLKAALNLVGILWSNMFVAVKLSACAATALILSLERLYSLLQPL